MYAHRTRNTSSSSSGALTDESLPPKLPQPPKPVVNVWSLRMEQMAATRAAQKNPLKDTDVPEVDRDDPFVVRLPDHLRSQRSLPPHTKDKGQHHNWPQVGEAISISASLSDSIITENVSENSASPRKSENTKWVSIPKQEVQAAADAAFSKRVPNSRRPHRQPPADPNTTTSKDRASASASAPSLPPSQSQTPSAPTTTASHSRAQSLHSSPKLAKHGKKLPPESARIDGEDANRALPADSPNDDERSNERSRTNNDFSTRSRRGTSSQLQPVPRSAEATPLPLSTNQSHSAPVLYPLHPQLNHSSANSNASSSSSPPLQHLHLLSPPSASLPAQSLHPRRPPLPHPHGQSAHLHAPYPLYNLSIPSMNSCDYAPPDPADRSTLPHYGQSSSGSLLNGTGTISATVTDRNRDSPAETSKVSSTKSNDVPPRDKMVFGSIDVLSDSSDSKESNVKVEQEGKEDEKEKEKEKKKPFAIGVENGQDLPARSKATQKKTSGKSTGGRPPTGKDKSDKKDEKEKKARADQEEDSTASPSAIASKSSIVEPRWTFGTTSMPSPPLPTSSVPPSPSQPFAKIDTPAEDEPQFIHPINSGSSTPFILEPQSSSSYLPPSNIPLTSPLPMQNPQQQHPYHIHLHMHSPSSLNSSIPIPPLSIPVQIPSSIPTPSSTSDPDLEVKDFGFGFGDASGLGYAPMVVKERAREWEAERARERAAAETTEIHVLGFNGEDGIVSPMAETAVPEVVDKDGINEHGLLQREHMLSREHHLGRGRRGFSNVRGGYNDRGYRRPRGGGIHGGFSRGFGRGGGGGHYGSHHTHSRGGGISPVNSRGGLSPYNATPPHPFQTLPLDSSGVPSTLPPPAPIGGFYPHANPHPSHHPNPGRPYIPPGYEAFNPSPNIAGMPPPLPVDSAGMLLGQPQTHEHHFSQGQDHQMLPSPSGSGKHLTPPVPVPKTTISFPLDSTRYYLLGQLEYYLSPENMAQDFYLRQQMDARGWIPISLIASFNRVLHLTQDVQLVRDVLTLSSLVQVRGNMVRMGGWEPFVLPDAVPSTVEEQPLPYPYQNLTTNYYYPDDVPTGMDMNGEVGVGYHHHPELLHATSLHHHHYHHHDGNGNSGEGLEGSADVYSGGGGFGKAVGPLNGHVDVDDDDDDEVEIVMGQGVGTFRYDRRTASS